MFYEDYLNQKEKLGALFEKKKKIANQPICIRDIFMYSADIPKKDTERKLCIIKGALGEYDRKAYTSTSDSLQRLVEHFKFLAHLTTKYHQACYCEKNEDGEITIRSDCLNKITRLLSHEYSFYTKEPFSLEDLNFLISNIKEIASQNPINVHLLFSTIAVQKTDKSLLNMGIYVQCGKEPKIHTFCKAGASDSDIVYAGHVFTQQNWNASASVAHINEFTVPEDGHIIPNNGVFFVKTAGGAEYTQVIEICSDHSQHYFGRKLILHFADRENFQNIYEQVDHIVSSNYLDELRTLFYKLPKYVAHIDPITTRKYIDTMEDDLVNLSDLEVDQEEKYSNLLVEKIANNHLVIMKPSFGFKFSFVVQRERELDGFFNPRIKSEIDKHNKKVKEQFIYTQLAKNMNADDFTTRYTHKNDCEQLTV